MWERCFGSHLSNFAGRLWHETHRKLSSFAPSLASWSGFKPSVNLWRWLHIDCTHLTSYFSKRELKTLFQAQIQTQLQIQILFTHKYKHTYNCQVNAPKKVPIAHPRLWQSCFPWPTPIVLNIQYYHVWIFGMIMRYDTSKYWFLHQFYRRILGPPPSPV